MKPYLRRFTLSILVLPLLAFSLSGCGAGASPTPPPAGGLEAQPTQPPSVPTSASTMDVECGTVYFPVEEGASKTFAGSGPAGPYTEVNTITDVGTSAFLMQVDLTDIQWVETWKCTAEGLVQLMSDGGEWSMILSGPDGTGKIETLSQTGVTIPLSIAPGDSWSQETTFHLTSSSVNGDGRLIYEFHAVGPEDVSVPAGDFHAMRVDVKARMETAYGPEMTTYYEGTMWLVPELGRVKQSGETRVGDPSGEGLPATVELESYKIP